MTTKPTRLIINADDYGRTAGISKGIRMAHLQGVVTSTTCMMNLPTVEADLIMAMEQCPGLGLGVHLNLTSGKPLQDASAASHLFGEGGRFPGLEDFLVRLPDLDLLQVEGEWRAQIGRFVSVTGKKPTHLDSHHHSSFHTPGLFGLMLKLAGELGCAIRFPSWNGIIDSGIPEHLAGIMSQSLGEQMAKTNLRHPDGFISTFYDEGISLEGMLSILERLPGGTSEIMTHPGLVDASLDSAYSGKRADELAVLTDPHLKARIGELGIQLIHFGAL